MKKRIKLSEIKKMMKENVNYITPEDLRDRGPEVEQMNETLIEKIVNVDSTNNTIKFKYSLKRTEDTAPLEEVEFVKDIVGGEEIIWGFVYNSKYYQNYDGIILKTNNK